MKQYEIAEKLASTMQQEGCELDCTDGAAPQGRP